jgi:flagellar biogenesis protein FliO
MKHALAWFLLATPAWAVQIQSIQVAGENTADVSFTSDAALPSMPRLSVEENQIDLSFTGVSAGPSVNKEIASPHALIQRIRTEAVAGGVRVNVVVNGSTEKLRDRVKLQKNAGGVSLVLTYPAGSAATLKLFQEEQSSIEAGKPAAIETKNSFGWFRLLLIGLLFVATGFASWFFVKFAKKKSLWKGSRRHLIEIVANAPLGEGKASVAILRVGGEFVLVGVTASQVSLVSRLPKLEAQYEEENSLERDSFKEAIAQEARRSSTPRLNV